jgi:HD-GYP domain-containing protein (c-di-GMP phosphodiesterase class II)
VLLRLLAERRKGASPRVAELAVRVGRKLGLAIGELDVLVRAAELHDLGKRLIPDAILTKSEPLASLATRSRSAPGSSRSASPSTR